MKVIEFIFHVASTEQPSEFHTLKNREFDVNVTVS